MRFMKKIQSLVELPVRVLGPLKKREFINTENNKEYNFTLARIHRKKGVSCMIRAKNEEDKILSCLDSILGVFEEVIFIDNGSSDATLAKVESFAIQHKEQRIQIYQYPHAISRCGDEHKQTDKNSLASLAYYYNWCLSRCSHAYVCKWDADMILHPQDKEKLGQKLMTYSSWWPTYLGIEIQTVYLKGEDVFLSKGEVNSEIMIFPNRSDVFFIKAPLFELLKAKLYRVSQTKMKDVRIYELKNVSSAEFSHWSSIEFSTKRKEREWINFNKVAKGQIDGRDFLLITDRDLAQAVRGGVA